ncbi:S8 family serine peptidase [Actinoplanes sp. GCM10030250]|uniref:S8 family serine peptidase n=1 Tax=Actinoplanes sp. GCM10030250 TaxID=3273376 RepID=UPI00360F1D5C
MKSAHRRVIVGTVAASLAAGLGAFGVADAASTPSASAQPVRLIVGLKAGADAAIDLTSLRALGLAGADARGRQLSRGLLAEVGAKSLEIPKSRASAAISALRRDPDVAYVQVDPKAKAYDYAPNDPIFTAGNQPELAQIKVPTAWDTTRGGSVKVAVVDTGVSAVGDLAGRVLPGYDFANNDFDPADDGDFPHGTVVASLIAASQDNGTGIAGVCAECEILPVKALGSDGSGWYSDIAEGIIYAAREGAKIINLSLGSPEPSPILQDAVAYAAGRGALVVVAAGNEGNTAKQYPAAYGDVLAVGATDTRSGGTARASFSSYGSWVDVAAPGITAGMRNNGAYCWDGNTATCWDSYYGEYEVQGTSFAAPLVAGVAALVASKNPRYSGWSIGNSIRASARKVSWVEKGVVDASAALTKGTDTVAPTATGISPAQNAKVRGNVTITPTGLKDDWSSIRAIDLYVDGKWHSWDYTYPWGPKLYTRGRNGAVKVQMKIIDKAGNFRWTGVRTLVMDNVLPAATITKAPKNKARVKGTVNVSVKASDKSGISKVQLLVNGKVVATDTKAGYKLSFKVAKQKKTMKVRIRVYDKAGNVRYLTTRTYYRA